MENKSVLSTLKFILSTTVVFVLIFSAVVVTVLNMYKPTLRVSIDDKFIGYFENEEEFEDVYKTLVSEKKQLDPEVKVYLKEEPNFEEAYIRTKMILEQNVYTALRDEVKTEFAIYNVMINDKKEMTFNNINEANKYVNDLKKEVPKVKSEVVAEKVETLGEMTTLEVADNIYKDVVSRNKPVIVTPKKKPVVNTTAKANTIGPTYVAATGEGVWPSVNRRINCHYMGYPGHTGIDIGGAVGTAIYAYRSGVVTFAGWGSGYGLHVKIAHADGITTYYAHASELFVSAGQQVNEGQMIAKIGMTGYTTGPHLHFEVRINGRHVNPYPYIVGK